MVVDSFLSMHVDLCGVTKYLVFYTDYVSGICRVSQLFEVGGGQNEGLLYTLGDFVSFCLLSFITCSCKYKSVRCTPMWIYNENLCHWPLILQFLYRYFAKFPDTNLHSGGPLKCLRCHVRAPARPHRRTQTVVFIFSQSWKMLR